MSPTAKQRHRARALALHRNDMGLVRCALRERPEHTCGGRLQVHHVLPVQTLTRLHRQAALAARQNHRRLLAWEKALLAVSLDELIADGRNAEIVCELGHRQLELRRFSIAPSQHLKDFLAEYHLTDEREAA